MNPFREPDPSRLVHHDHAWDAERNAASGNHSFRSVTRRERILAALTALFLLVPLVVACLLEPDARGYGTHQQLGFPPCTLVALCGVRCPTCGMTTAWAALVRGRLLDGLAANVGGVLLGLAAIGALIGLVTTVVFGRRPKWFPGLDRFAWIGTAIAAVTLIDWTVRILFL